MATCSRCPRRCLCIGERCACSVRVCILVNKCGPILGVQVDSCNVRKLQVWLDIVPRKCYLLEVCKRVRSN